MKGIALCTSALILLLSMPSGDAAQSAPHEVMAVFGAAQDRTAASAAKVETRFAKGFGMMKEGAAHDAGEFYRASGRVLRLFRSLDKVIARTENTATAQTQLSAAGGTEFKLQATVPELGRHIFEAEQRCTEASLNAVLGIADTDPVYINEETGSELLVTERFVVRLAPGADRAALETLNAAHGVVVVSALHGTDREYICRKPHARATHILTLSETYSREACVAWASPDFVFALELYHTPTDPLYANQWHLNNTGQSGATMDADVDAPEAWDRVDTPQGGSPDVVIAIIDSGVDLDHEDLDENIYENTGEATGTPGADDDSNGYVDDVNGWDFYHDDNNPRPTIEPHGTAVAGVSAAEEGNGLGGVGMAFNCRILPVKIASDSGLFASSTGIANGLRYAADMAHVLNNSWGGGGDDNAIHSAIQYAVNTRGKVVLFATGNSASGVPWYSPCWLMYILPTTGGTRFFEWGFEKDGSLTDGDDCVWIDDIVFPDGSREDFEDGFPPTGWSRGGNALWSQYGESTHVLGTGCYSAKSGDISHYQSTWIKSPQKTFLTSDLTFYAWVDCEDFYDYGYVSVEGLGYIYLDDWGGIPDYDVGYPARYSECIAVGASTDYDIRSDYSQYDETLFNVLDFVAPSNGGNWGITTTDITGSAGYSSGSYANDFGGTSSATPLAAGIAALILSKNPNLTPGEVKNILETSADEIGCESYTGHYNKYHGHGRANAYNALDITPLPPALGACCMPDGSCAETLEAGCTGDWLGTGTDCDPKPCSQATGACCLGDGTCTVLTEADCNNASGDYQGDGTDCTPDPCPQFGACCAPDGSCSETLEAGCTGDWLGPGTDCDPNPCPQPTGACCLGDGTCSVLTEAECNSAGGDYQGNSTDCAPTPCPQLGSCCMPDSSCAETLEVNCTGSWLGPGTDCDPNQCSQAMGACCLGGGTCTVLTEADCNNASGDYQGDGTDCTPNPCPQLGACCTPDGRCVETLEVNCTGNWQGLGTDCDPDPCPQPTGACCLGGSTCSVLTEAYCNNVGGDYQGDGADCTPNPCLGTDCNNNGISDQQDRTSCDGSPWCSDCDGNGALDACDIADDTSQDCDGGGVPDECQPDADGDGVIDACDGCPDDAYKDDPGLWGCAVPDVDGDGDGVIDRIDNCPTAPNPQQADSLKLTDSMPP